MGACDKSELGKAVFGGLFTTGFILAEFREARYGKLGCWGIAKSHENVQLNGRHGRV